MTEESRDRRHTRTIRRLEINIAKEMVTGFSKPKNSGGMTAEQRPVSNFFKTGFSIAIVPNRIPKLPLLCYLQNLLSHRRACFDRPLIIPFLLGVSFLPIQIGVEVVAETFRRVIEAKLLINRIQLVQVLLFQLEIPSQIALNSLGRLALRQHTVSICYPPRQSDLSTIFAVFFANLDNGWVVNQFTHIVPGAVDRVLIAKGRVVGNVDAFASVKFRE